MRLQSRDRRNVATTIKRPAKRASFNEAPVARPEKFGWMWWWNSCRVASMRLQSRDRRNIYVHDIGAVYNGLQ